MITENLISQLEDSTRELEAFLALPSENEVTYTPSPTYWSVLDVLEHLFLRERMVLKFTLSTSAKQLTEGPKEIFGTERIKTIFTNFERKFRAPEMIAPTQQFPDWEPLKQLYMENRKALRLAIEAQASTLQTSYFAHPLMGDLTKYEWIHFLIYHSDRHLVQMKNALKAARERV